MAPHGGVHPPLTRSTHLLSAGLTVTILRLQRHLQPATVRAMIAAELYVLAGQSRANDGSNSYACYVGQSDALHAHTNRVGASLRTWTFRLGRLTPDTIVLVRGATGPIDTHARLLVEAGLARAISTTHTILNTRTAAPRRPGEQHGSSASGRSEPPTSSPPSSVTRSSATIPLLRPVARPASA